MDDESEFFFFLFQPIFNFIFVIKIDFKSLKFFLEPIEMCKYI